MLKPQLQLAVQILKRLNHDKPRTMYSIAEELGVSVAYVEQTTQLLRVTDMVIGKKGPGGGCMLITDLDALKLATVFQAIYHRKPLILLDDVRVGQIKDRLLGEQ